MDKLQLYQDKAGEWRWTRRAPNNEEVGASTEGYKNYKDCWSNAFRINGTPPDLEYLDPEIPEEPAE